MLFLWVVILGVGACERPRPPTPELAAYRAFAEAVRRGDPKVAFSTLSVKSQRLMEARAASLSTASLGALKPDPAGLLFQSGFRPTPKEDARVVESDGRRAVIEVKASGEPRRVVLVREAERWVVDLEDIL